MMIPRPFDYHAPRSLAEAIALLATARRPGQGAVGRAEPAAAAQACGWDQPSHLVDIGRIPGLEYIKEDGGFLKIGGRTQRVGAGTVRSRSQTKYPILHDTALVIADPSCATARRSAATSRMPIRPTIIRPPCSRSVPRSRRPARRASERSRSIDFFTGLFTTALDRGRNPDRNPDSDPAAAKRWRLCQARTQGRRLCDGGRGRAGDARRRRHRRALRNRPDDRRTDADQSDGSRSAFCSKKRPTAKRSRRPHGWLAQAASPTADRRGSVEYKREMARVLTARALPWPSSGREDTNDGERTTIRVTVNGTAHEPQVDSRLLLVHFLRDELAADGYAYRLRYHALRRVHGARRRRAGQVLHGAGRSSQWRRRHHG